LILVALSAAALWRMDLLTAPAQTSDMPARMTRIETRIDEMAARPAPAGDSKALDAITGRLAKIETSIANPTSGGAENSAIKAMADEISALRTRIDEIATLARGAQESAAAAQKQSQSDDKAGRRAIVAGALQAAVERGEPFAAELMAARSLADNADSLSALEPFAAKGLLSAASLSRELAATIPALLRASSVLPADAGILDKLQANAERIVRVRPVGNATGDDAASTIARIEVRASQADIDGALAELMKLPAPIRASADSWIKSAEQRKAALAASRQFTRGALAALGNPAQ
jgi:hypothetical protein